MTVPCHLAIGFFLMARAIDQLVAYFKGRGQAGLAWVPTAAREVVSSRSHGDFATLRFHALTRRNLINL